MLRIAYQFPDCLQRLYRGVVWRIKSQEKQPSVKHVYLSFDDGCIPEVTPRVLDILAHYEVHATFFCVGDNIRKYPEVFSRIVAEGHQVGNHTYHHLAGLKTSTVDYIKDVSRTDELLQQYLPLGMQNPLLFRPPYGRMRFSQKRHLLSDHTVVLWDVLTHDYNPRYTPERIVNIVKRYTRDGSVIVFHDSLKSEAQMLPALPQVIEFLKNENYIFEVIPPNF